MKNQKKLQIFISSTFIDLKDERQAAVEAILKAGHIPAGMELFTASNKSQWDIIKRWIDESDIYMLILGGRYGSIEPDSGKSYTHLEYEYAQSINKPLFAVIIEESELSSRRADYIEKVNPSKLHDFRKIVLGYISSFFKDERDIKLAVHESLGQITQDHNLTGWIRGNKENSDFANQIMTLNEELKKTKEENERFKLAQVKRLPEIMVSINDSQNLEFELDVDESKFYKKREHIKEIPRHLTDYLSQEEVDGYNRSLSNISELKINQFNQVQTQIYALSALQNKIKIQLFNKGNAKATDIHIYMTFPDFILVTDNQKEISNQSTKLNNELLGIIPNPYSDPIIEAEDRYSQDIKLGTLDYVTRLLDRTSFIKPYTIEPLIHHRSLPIAKNVHNYSSVKDNTLKIVNSKLTHNLSASYDNYLLIPLRKNTGVIKVKVICDEHSLPAIYEIPITIK